MPCMRGIEDFWVCAKIMNGCKDFITNMDQIKSKVLGPFTFFMQERIFVTLSPPAEKIELDELWVSPVRALLCFLF